MKGLRQGLGIGLLLVASTASAVTLHDAVTAALQEHPSVNAAKANELVNQFGIMSARGAYFPQVAIRAARGRETSDNSFVRVSLNQPELTLTRKEAQLTFSQMLFDGLRVFNQVKVQRFNLASSNYRLAGTEQTLMRDVAEAYLNVLRSRELVYLARNNIQVHQETWNTVDVLFRGGAGTTGEVQLANSRLALAKLNLNEAQGVLARAEARYLSLLGTLPPDYMEKAPSLDTYIPKTLEEATDIAYLNNPGLNRLRALEKSAAAEVGVAKAVFVPRLSLDIQASHNDNLDGLPGLNRDASALLTVNYPLFSGGTNWATLNQARARRLEARENVEATRRTVAENLVRAWNDYHTDISRTRRQREYIDFSKKVVVDFKEQFTLGKRALFNVLDSQNELYRARTGLTEAYYDSLIDTYRILESMGVLSERMM